MLRATQMVRLASGLAGLALLAGCEQAVDRQMRVAADVGVPDERAIAVAEVEFTCPHLVPINEREFNPKDVERGEVDGVFGPFVPCNATITQGADTCSKCANPVRTPGMSADGENPAPVASWKMSCPFCHEAVDPGAVQVRGKDPKNPQRFALNQCTNDKCGRYYETAPIDVLTTLGVHEEVVCPACKKPIDPSLNECKNGGCSLASRGLTVRNVEEMEGPCWRCGGQGICPSCNGSGSGTQAVYGDTPTNCWACDTAGRCQECQGSGFTTYEGGLPPKFATIKGSGDNARTQESSTRGWQHPSDAPAPAEDAPPGE